MNSDPIVITGASLITALGLTRQQTWQAIRENRCGMGLMPALESPPPPGATGGQALDLPEDYWPELSRESRYLKRAVADAIADAGFDQNLPYDPARRGVMLGTTLHGMRSAGVYLRSGNFDALGEFLAPQVLAWAVDSSQFQGLCATTCSACSSSLGSIGLAVTLLQTRQLDLVIAGGYDTISEYVYGGFNSLRLVASGPLRPFAKDRQGMKLAEGYGIVILERAGDALKRGGKPLAAVLGFGESADAHHLTQPHPEGEGAARAIAAALADSGIGAGGIGLIAAHATGTPDNDAGEHAALARIFSSRLGQIPVVAFKSHLGHTLGGAGAVELILAMMALRDQIVPACANVTSDEIEFPDMLVATGASRPGNFGATLNTSLGFGGANTCVILGLPSSPSPGTPGKHQEREPAREVFITGIGIVLPGAIGVEALATRVESSTVPAWTTEQFAIPESDYIHLLNARRVRRMSDYVKYTLAATALAITDARIPDATAFTESCSVILGSTHGSSNYSTAYYEPIVKEGLIGANPMLFAEGVPNAAAAHVSLMLGLKGACQTVIGSRTAGLDALRLAWLRISSGRWDRAIVGAGEEYCPLITNAYRHCGLAAPAFGEAAFGSANGFVMGCGAVTIILESRESLERRQGRALARIESCASANGSAKNLPRSLRRILGELGNPRDILASASGCRFDAAEAGALGGGSTPPTVGGLYGHMPELFSAGPLAAIAATLAAGHLPRLLGKPRFETFLPATGSKLPDQFAAICHDFSGPAAGVVVQRIAEKPA
jgi:3-oxoacyl-[acyl-carrier-protein] synthase II